MRPIGSRQSPPDLRELSCWTSWQVNRLPGCFTILDADEVVWVTNPRAWRRANWPRLSAGNCRFFRLISGRRSNSRGHFPGIAAWENGGVPIARQMLGQIATANWTGQDPYGPMRR